MIIDALLYMLYGIIWLLLSPLRLLPDVSLPLEVSSAISSVSGYLSSLNFFLPMSSILTIIFLIITIEATIFTYKVIMWLIKKIPSIN